MARVIDLMQKREALSVQLALQKRDHAELVAAILKKIAEVSKVLDEYKAMVDTNGTERCPTCYGYGDVRDHPYCSGYVMCEDCKGTGGRPPYVPPTGIAAGSYGDQVLELMTHEPGRTWSPAELGRLLPIKPETLTVVLSRLKKRGFICSQGRAQWSMSRKPDVAWSR
jgi:hypothetical protein